MCNTLDRQGTPAERQITNKTRGNPGKVVWRSAFQEKAPGVKKNVKKNAKNKVYESEPESEEVLSRF